MLDDRDDRKLTRHLSDPDAAKPMEERETGPLDDVIPWVIEFRVVGTHHLIKASVKELMMIGRQDERNGVFPDIDLSQFAAQALGVSRRHAMIEVKRNKVTLRDLNSPNGTYINDHVLTPNQEYRLRNGDQLRFGRLQLQIHFVVKPVASDNTQEISNMGDLKIERIGAGERVLVVDDDSQVANLLETVLRQAGFEPLLTTSVTDAITVFDQQRPQMVISELMLPDRSGLEFVQYVRGKIAGDEKIPIMVVSSATAGFQMGQAIEHGIDIFLGKPFAIDELVRGIGKLVSEIG